MHEASSQPHAREPVPVLFGCLPAGRHRSPSWHPVLFTTGGSTSGRVCLRKAAWVMFPWRSSWESTPQKVMKARWCSIVTSTGSSGSSSCRTRAILSELVLQGLDLCRPGLNKRRSSVSPRIVAASASAGLMLFLIMRAGARREQDASLVSLSPAGEGRPLDRFTLPMYAMFVDSFLSAPMGSRVTRASSSVDTGPLTGAACGFTRGLAEAVTERASVVGAVCTGLSPGSTTALRTTFAGVSRARMTQDVALFSLVTSCTHEGAHDEACERGCEPAWKGRRRWKAPLRLSLLLPGFRRLLRAPGGLQVTFPLRRSLPFPASNPAVVAGRSTAVPVAIDTRALNQYCISKNKR